MKVISYSAVSVVLILVVYFGVIQYQYSRYSKNVESKIVFYDSARNLKKIVLAIKNYQIKFGTDIPINKISDNGKRITNWRVLILPFLNNDDFKELPLKDADEIILHKDSVSKMPNIYASPVKEYQRGISAESGLTSYFLMHLSEQEILRIRGMQNKAIAEPHNESQKIIVVDSASFIEFWDLPQFDLHDPVLKKRMIESKKSLFIDLSLNVWSNMDDSN